MHLMDTHYINIKSCFFPAAAALVFLLSSNDGSKGNL
jgi:hypothetical protein